MLSGCGRHLVLSHSEGRDCGTMEQTWTVYNCKLGIQQRETHFKKKVEMNWEEAQYEPDVYTHMYTYTPQRDTLYM